MGNRDLTEDLDNLIEETEGCLTHDQIAYHFFTLGKNETLREIYDWLLENANYYILINNYSNNNGGHFPKIDINGMINDLSEKFG